jgi:hypothetical protein
MEITKYVWGILAVVFVLAAIHGVVSGLRSRNSGSPKPSTSAAGAGAPAMLSGTPGCVDPRTDALEFARQLDIDTYGTDGHFVESTQAHRDWRDGND